MTDFSVIAIIATIITVGIAGFGILITLFLYLLRRMDTMQREISEVKIEMRERFARLEGILIGRQEDGADVFTQTGDD